MSSGTELGAFRLDSPVKNPDTNPFQTPSKLGHPSYSNAPTFKSLRLPHLKTNASYLPFVKDIMQNAESHAHILFFVELKAHSPYQPVPKPRMCPPMLSWIGGQSLLHEGIHCFQLVVQPRFLISRDAASHRAFGCDRAKTGQSVTST